MLKIEKQSFGEMKDGQKVDLYTLVNSNDMRVSITSYGGIITKIIVPDKDGKMGDVVLGFNDLAGYLANEVYFGAIVGRYGNRIAKGKFKLNNFEYSLATNNGPNHLHGGVKGFDKVLWTAKEINQGDQSGLELNYVSPDGEEGYPGTMQVKVLYRLTDQNELCINYKATSDKPTICNLTNHSYFNLKDAGKSSIMGHKLIIDADNFTPVNETMIPTGEFLPVEGTPFDFRKEAIIGSRIDENHAQLQTEPRGYDHNFILKGKNGEMRRAAVVSEISSGRMLEVFTREPGVQFYSGNFLNGRTTGKDGVIYKQYSGLCLETQHFPDSPNHPNFPSTVLNPGETYKQTTIYKFSTK